MRRRESKRYAVKRSHPDLPSIYTIRAQGWPPRRRPNRPRNVKMTSVCAGHRLGGAPRRNRTGDPILTMEPPGTAVRTAVRAGHARPSGPKLSVHSTRSYGFSYRRGDRRPSHTTAPSRIGSPFPGISRSASIRSIYLPPLPWPGWPGELPVGAGFASPRREPSTRQVW